MADQNTVKHGRIYRVSDIKTNWQTDKDKQRNTKIDTPKNTHTMTDQNRVKHCHRYAHCPRYTDRQTQERYTERKTRTRLAYFTYL